MKEIHDRRNWPWWKSQIIQKYSNSPWIWQKIMSFENNKYSVDKDPYQWCLRQSKRLKSIDAQMNIQMRNHELLTQNPEDLEHEVKCKCNHNCTLDEMANTLQDVRKRTNIGKYTPYKSSGFKEKHPFIVEFKDKAKERVAEVAKKRNSCHDCGSTDHYANNCPKAKKNVYSIEKYQRRNPQQRILTQNLWEMPSENNLMKSKTQEETPLETQDINLEAGMPQDTANKALCKHTQDAQTFLVTPNKGMEYIHPIATKMTVFIDNAQHPLIIDSGAHCSIVARNYLDNHFPNWENQLFHTKRKNFKSASGKMASIGTIIKEILVPHRKRNIRLNPEFVVLKDAYIQGFLLGTDYQRMYGINIYNSKNRHIAIGTNKEKKFSLDIYQKYAQEPIEELLNEFREGQFITTLTSKQKLSLMKMLRKNRPEFAIGEEPLGKIRGHDIELYLDVERLYPPMHRRPP
ncbi:hypothetical protein O181_037900 [Austropuccinia psidii MF-1]|uniref:CCHC-type domain-containing protein n=1 Tax=Austropuccinia psidii MF-1 TaxID=1389203 RepID=A0A9Q3DBW7_9BASI|nr:hypothetical protein [Austropuccinia psidii MF-1]